MRQRDRSRRALAIAAGAFAFASSSLSRAEPTSPASVPAKDFTPRPNLFFFDLAATIGFPATQDVPKRLPPGRLAGATGSFGVREHLVSLPATAAYRALDLGVGLQASALANGAGGSGRLTLGSTLRLSFATFDEAGPDRQLPGVDLYAFASPWLGAEDLGQSGSVLVGGSRFGVGVTALAWSRAVMRTFYCRAPFGDGPPIGLFICVMTVPVWGPAALFNHAEVLADVARYPGEALVPRVGFSFGTGF
jgi:hypothetical protein